ncbi:head GIN domain-containing protein [Maribacter sp. 2-571]|uniref:head GIN domain-containing protein n=1 Tax=Maribacter sp. 2-571 TaxID=3417569 RepID=UPI003D325F94
MRKIITMGALLITVLGNLSTAEAQDNTFSVKTFDKIIISPHIEVTLKEGSEESVVVNDSKVTIDKINAEVSGKTLRVYLDGAKVLTKSEKVNYDNYKGRRSIYNGTQATVTITYRNLKNLSVRGEERIHIASAMNQKDMKLSIFGESKVYFDDLTAEELTVAIYGESYLEISDGSVNHQVYRAYGESEVNAGEIRNKSTKITAYGESNFRVKVSDRLKITCYGEASINYSGNPEIDKGIVIGEATIRKMG